MKALTEIKVTPVRPSDSSAERLSDILAPIFEAAVDSPSLVASRHVVEADDQAVFIPKFLLLGQRGGGRPLRTALFAGLDTGSLETTIAVTRLLLQFELNPALAKDYALFGYPVVNLRGFGEERGTLRDFEARYAKDGSDPDVRFFRGELQNWSFDGMISLRVDERASSFHATSRSEVIAKEVVSPALSVISGNLPVDERAVRLRPSDRYARLADHAHGKLSPIPGARPYPFEIEIFAPGAISFDQRVTGLFLTVQEILRNYRRVTSHAQNI